MQLPEPLQVDALWALPPPHAAAAQMVPFAYTRQRPAPLQVPSEPQLAAPWSLHDPCGSSPPAGTVAQVPCAPGSAHEKQLPAHAVVQQTPCSQWVDAH
jgi:hypothetical protein